jgi:hypothetical protein
MVEEDVEKGFVWVGVGVELGVAGMRAEEGVDVGKVWCGW